MLHQNTLLVADSEHDANMLYAAGLLVPEPFICLQVRGQTHLILSDPELERACGKACRGRVSPLSRYERRLKKQGVENPETAHVIAAFLREQRVKKVRVPGDFPLGLAQQLRRLKIKLKPVAGGLFPQRQFKSADEVKKISAALMMAEVGLAEAIQALKIAKINPAGKLLYRNAPLTSEKLRSIIEVAILQAGGVTSRTIVAGGRQACDPREEGYGLLKANQPIVMDIFPRSRKTGYFGAIARTVVKGRASEAVRKLYATVEHGQRLAMAQMRHGARAGDIHQSVVDFFSSQGYTTSRKNGRPQGFLHGTGHGVGLEIREAPGVHAQSRDTLQAGQVVSVEPGLYFPQLGGMCLDDMALITANGPRHLTRFEKVLELP